jgi:hypothetical protein
VLRAAVAGLTARAAAEAADPAAPGDVPPADEAAAPADDDMPPPTQNGRYHHIRIVVEPADSGGEPAPDTVAVDRDAC